MTRAEAAKWAGVQPRTIDQWVHRGHLRRGDGYDLLELAGRILGRDDTMAAGGAVAARVRDNAPGTL